MPTFLNMAQNLTALALPMFFTLILLEIWIPAKRGQQAYEVRDFLGSMSPLAGNIIVQILFKGLILGFYTWLYQYRIFTVGLGLLGLVATAIAIDFVFYWYHRASHRVRILWAVHVAHHSSEHMNLGTALRQFWFGPLSKPVFYWCLPLLGFHPLAILGVGALLTIYGFWTHTEQVRRIGWLEYIFVLPAHHRVHHGSNPLYIDKNYANFLIIWDKLFGTFQDETENVEYGLVRNINSFNPVVIACHEWLAIGRDLVRKPGRWAKVLFAAPDSQKLE